MSTGAGRPPGALNKRTVAVKSILDDLIPDRDLARQLWTLALRGDGRVATYLADRKWGRVKYDVGVSGDPDGAPVIHEHRFIYVDGPSGSARVAGAQASQRATALKGAAGKARRKGSRRRSRAPVGQDDRSGGGAS